MLWSTVVLAVRAIRRNLMRAFLTILGIIIGVSAVVSMVTLLGAGIDDEVVIAVGDSSRHATILAIDKGMPGASSERPAAPEQMVMEPDPSGGVVAEPPCSRLRSSPQGSCAAFVWDCGHLMLSLL